MYVCQTFEANLNTKRLRPMILARQGQGTEFTIPMSKGNNLFLHLSFFRTIIVFSIDLVYNDLLRFY